MLQGIKTNLLNAEFSATYRFRQNVYIDLIANYRKQSTELNQTLYDRPYIALSFRMNFAQQDFGF